MGRGFSMTQKRMGFAIRAVVTSFVTAVAMMAQTGGGATLVGTVKDGTGAAVAQARVTVVNTATSFVTTNVTTGEGAYYGPYLIPADYRVTGKPPAFTEFSRE